MKIEIGTHTELIKAADEIRQMVFIDEQGVPEEEIFDGLNHEAIHIVAFHDDVPVATARVIKEGASWRIALVAVDKSKRGLHLGEKVMEAAARYIMANNGRKIILTAQEEVRGFYEKLGFVQNGKAKTFESGVALIPMELCL